VPLSDSVGISGDVVLTLYSLRMEYLNTRLDAAMGQMQAAQARSQLINKFLEFVAAHTENGVGGDAAKYSGMIQADHQTSMVPIGNIGK
jgi:hypothetical protein